MASPQFIDGVSHSFKCGGGCNRGDRVVLDNVTGEIEKAAATDVRLGVVTRSAQVGDFVDVRFPVAGSAIYRTNVSIGVGDKVYGANDGLVGTTNTNEPIGIAFTSSTGTAGELITVIHNSNV